VSYHYNVVAIVKKAPKLLGLREMLDAFLEHREQVVLARTRYDLAASKKREHIVDGLIQALSILDQVIAVIRKSANKSDARNNLMDQFGFTHEQAEAIITLQLYRLSNTDINALKKEAKELAAKIKKLEGILTSKTKRKNLMIQELQELLEAEPTPRLSQIEEQVEEIVIDQRDMIADEPVMLVASEQGYIKKVSMRSFSSSQNQPAGKKEGDWIVLQQQVSTLDTLLLFTDRGRFAQIPVYELDEAKWKESGTHFSTWFKTDSQEKITAAFVERNPSQNLDLLLASAKGMVKRIEREQLPPKRGMRMTAVMSLFASDRMAAVAPLSHEQDIVLASREGLSFALDSSQVSTSSLKTRGVRGMNLAENDELIFAGPVSESLIIEDDGGRLKRIAADQIGKLNRPAKGARLFKAVKSRPCTLSYAAAADEKTEIAFQDEDQSKVAVSSLSKMAPSSTWPASSPLPTCAPALPFEQRLQSGTIERKMPDKQLTLFGDQ
jgi:topoisomerase-4 subunit A